MKKAQHSTLSALIIILIVALFLFVFVTKIGEESGSILPKQLCRLSVEAKAKVKLLQLGTESETFLDCHTNYVTIDREGIKISNENMFKGKEIEAINFKKTTQTPDDAIKKYLADQLYDCWDQFGKGEIDFLGEYDWMLSDFRCFPCANIYFDENYLNGFTYGDWEKYLADQTSPNGDSYKSYLT